MLRRSATKDASSQLTICKMGQMSPGVSKTVTNHGAADCRRMDSGYSRCALTRRRKLLNNSAASALVNP